MKISGKKDQKMRNISTSESNTWFDLSTGPLLRVTLTQTEEERYVFFEGESLQPPGSGIGDMRQHMDKLKDLLRSNPGIITLIIVKKEQQYQFCVHPRKTWGIQQEFLYYSIQH